MAMCVFLAQSLQYFGLLTYSDELLEKLKNGMYALPVSATSPSVALHEHNNVCSLWGWCGVCRGC